MSLNLILFKLIASADKIRGSPAHTELKGGLHIALMQLPDRPAYILEISREDTYPSTIEFRTIVNHWPWRFPTCIPTMMPNLVTKHFALVAEIPFQSRFT